MPKATFKGDQMKWEGGAATDNKITIITQINIINVLNK